MMTMVQRNVALRMRVGAHTMAVPHPGRALFPSGFTAEDAVDYYRAIAPVLVRHLAGRAVSGDAKGAPQDRVSMVFPAHPTPADGVALAIAAAASDLEIRMSPWKLAAVEPHSTSEAAVSTASEGRRLVDRLVFALVPEPWGGLLECREAALTLRDKLIADGFDPVVKTSGSTILHVWAGLAPTEVPKAVEYATAIASRITDHGPGRVLPMPISATPFGPPMPLETTRKLAGIDVDVAAAEVSAIAPYSLRQWDVVHRTGHSGPAVSAPITWRELEQAQSAAELSFEPWEVVARIQRDGDLFARLFTDGRDVEVDGESASKRKHE